MLAHSARSEGTAGPDDSSALAFKDQAQITAALIGYSASEITPPVSLCAHRVPHTGHTYCLEQRK